MSEINLGDKVTDKITGFQGIVTGIVHHITGCHQALLAPKVKEDGALVRSEWFDLDRLEVLSSGAFKLQVSDPGPDREAPVK